MKTEKLELIFLYLIKYWNKLVVMEIEKLSSVTDSLFEQKMKTVFSNSTEKKLMASYFIKIINERSFFEIMTDL